MGAVLEALQAFLANLPAAELRVRLSLAAIEAPQDAPAAQGPHPPTFGEDWPHTTVTLHDDPQRLDELALFGVHVREPGDLPYADPPV